MQEGDPQWWRIKGLLAPRKNPIILELGAYDGWHTWMFAEIAPDATIYAFEPDPRCLAEINASRGMPPNAELIAAAIGSHTGHTLLYLSEAGPGFEGSGAEGSSSIRKPAGCVEWYPLKFDKSVTVPVWTLDDWCRSRGIEHVDLLFVDIQGAERDMIEHGHETLARTDWLSMEMDPPEAYEGSWGGDQIRAALGPKWREEVTVYADTLFQRVP